MAVYVDGVHAVDVLNVSASSPIYACAFLGGLKTRARIMSPLRPYEFVSSRESSGDSKVFGKVGGEGTPVPHVAPSWWKPDEEVEAGYESAGYDSGC